MSAPPVETARYLHQDAYKRFTAGNRSLKHIVDYMEDRARLEMDYSAGLESLAGKWNKKLTDTLDFEYLDFRRVLKDVFSEPMDKAKLHNKVANKILNEAAVLKKHFKDQFKRDAQTAIMDKYKEAMEKQTRLEEKVNKAKKKYFKKKQSVEKVQQSIEEFPYRSDKSPKHHELQLKLTELSEQVTDAYLKYESRLRVESTNRPEFAKDMNECEEAYNDHEYHRLLSVRDRIVDMLKGIQTFEGDERAQCRENMDSLLDSLSSFPVKDCVTSYGLLFVQEHPFLRLQEYQAEKRKSRSGNGMGENETILGKIQETARTSGSMYRPVPPIKQKAVSPQPRPQLSLGRGTSSPVLAWESDGSENEDLCNSRHAKSNVIQDDANEDNVPLGASDEFGGTETCLRVVAVHAHEAKNPSELSFEVGQIIKQTFPANKEGWAYGWIRSKNFGKRRYGTYPADCVKPKPKKKKE